MDVFFCSFANSIFSPSIERLKKQIRDSNFFTDSFFYTERELGKGFKREFKALLRAKVRGFGYWVWKPYVMLEALKRIPENSILLYCDTGCHITGNGGDTLKGYIELADKYDIVVSELVDPYTVENWTKRSLIEYFGVGDRADILKSPQLQAGMVFLKNNDYTRKILTMWLDVYRKDISLVDDSPSTIPNISSFQQHRHDQSVLTIILRLNHCGTIPEYRFFSVDKAKMREIETQSPITHSRDLRKRKTPLGMLRSLLSRIKRMVTVCVKLH